MAAVTKFRTGEQLSAAAVLADAEQYDFDQVLLVGIKGGKLTICVSESADTAKTIGLLEIAKMDLYGHMD